MIPRHARDEAAAFRVWREAVAVDWACSAQDLAEATGVPAQRIRRIAARRGWPLRKMAYSRGGSKPLLDFEAIGQPSPNIAGRGNWKRNIPDGTPVDEVMARGWIAGA